ncbi:replication protein, partial [Streptomyces sp. NPDC088554]
QIPHACIQSAIPRPAQRASKTGFRTDRWIEAKADGVRDFIGVSDFGEAASVGELISGLRDRQSTVKDFQKSIELATKRGASKDLISQLIEMGLDSQLAGLVSRATGSDMKQLNSLVKSGGALASSYGKSMADYMFDAGKDAGRGFLTGLLGQEKAIQDAMAEIGNKAIKAIRSKKGIDAHSPSRKGEVAGDDVGAGVVNGMVQSLPGIDRAATRLGAAAVPSVAVVPVSAGRSTTADVVAAVLAALDGRALALVLEDGTQLDTRIDLRVDKGLTKVINRKRAGAR